MVQDSEAKARLCPEKFTIQLDEAEWQIEECKVNWLALIHAHELEGTKAWVKIYICDKIYWFVKLLCLWSFWPENFNQLYNT